MALSKSCLLFFIAFLLLSSKPKSDYVKPSTKSKFFTITKTSKVKWQSGAPEGKGGAGIDYEFEITFTKDLDGYFKMIWIGNKFYQTKFKNTDQIKDYNHFKKGQTIKIFCTEMTRVPNNSYNQNDKNSTDPPFKYQGVAMLEYLYKGKTYCITVNTWNEDKRLDGI